MEAPLWQITIPAIGDIGVLGSVVKCFKISLCISKDKITCPNMKIVSDISCILDDSE